MQPIPLSKRSSESAAWGVDFPALSWAVLGLIAVTFLWPSYGEWKVSGVPNLAPPRLLKLALLSLLALQLMFSRVDFRRVGDRIAAHWVLFGLLGLYHLFRVVTFALDPNGFYWLYGYIKDEVFTNFLLMFAVMYMVRDERDVARVIKTLVIASVAVALMVVIESILKDSLFRSLVTGGGAATAMAFDDKSRDLSYRAQGTFGHPLILAQYATCLFPLAWWSMRQSKGVLKALLVLAIIGLVVSAVLSVTRSGEGLMVLTILAIGAHSFVGWWRSSKNNVLKMFVLVQALWILPLVAVLGWYGLLDMIAGRTFEEAHSSFARLDMLTTGVPKILAAPLGGYGPTNALVGVGFASHYGGRFVDNYFLLVGLQSGAIAALLLLVVFLMFARYGVPSTTDIGTPRSKLISMLGISMGAFLCFQIVHASSELFPLFYILAGCFVSLLTLKAVAPAADNPSATV